MSDIREPCVTSGHCFWEMSHAEMDEAARGSFFLSPCTLLTAPSSCVTLFSYLPSIKGFLMTRVNPEHEERRVGLKIKRPGFTWISSHSPLLWDEHFSRYHGQIKDAPGTHLLACVFSVNVMAGWRLEIKKKNPANLSDKKYREYNKLYMTIMSQEELK